MSNEGQCFRCGKQIEKGDGIEVWGGGTRERSTRVRVHESCNASFACRTVYFFGRQHEELRVFGTSTVAALRERGKLGLT